MDAQKLYDNLKEALEFFGIGWHRMEEMQCKFEDGKVIFFVEEENAYKAITFTN